jgi:hypothetical protein
MVETRTFNAEICSTILKVRFHYYMFETNLPLKQMLYIFVMVVSQKFVANQIGLPYPH